MSNIFNLLDAGPVRGDATYTAYMILSIALIALVFIASVLAIIIVLMQPGNSTGINALGGSSETFFGKNKGKSIEEKLKKVTYACLILIGVLSVIFYIFQYSGIWQ